MFSIFNYFKLFDMIKYIMTMKYEQFINVHLDENVSLIF